MKGLTLISAVNYSGKGEVVKSLRELWDENNLGEVEFQNATELMMQMIGAKSHRDLAAVEVVQRNELRRRMCENLAQSAALHPVFLDTHFVFEDEERAQFDGLMPVTRQIILVQSSPEMILKRAREDEKRSDHPGRSALVSKEFIISYMRDDERAARSYAKITARIRGVSEIPLIRINNNTDDKNHLREHIAGDIFPQVVSNLEGFNPTLLEHAPLPVRMSR